MYIILHIFIFNTTFRYSELISDETINKLFKFIDSELNNVYFSVRRIFFLWRNFHIYIKTDLVFL